MRKLKLAALITLGVGSLSAIAIAQGGPHGDRGGDRFERADIDGDGNVTLSEIEASKAERFNNADVDGSGGITFDEFNAFAEAEKAQREAKRRQRHFEKLDANGDGSISAEEHAAHRSDRMERMFDMIDSNNDDVISQEERDAALAARGERRGMRRKHMRGGQ